MDHLKAEKGPSCRGPSYGETRIMAAVVLDTKVGDWWLMTGDWWLSDD